MDDTQLNDLESADPVQVSKYRWLPMMEVEPGMVIARPGLGMAGGVIQSDVETCSCLPLEIFFK